MNHFLIHSCYNKIKNCCFQNNELSNRYLHIDNLYCLVILTIFILINQINVNIFYQELFKYFQNSDLIVLIFLRVGYLLLYFAGNKIYQLITILNVMELIL